MADPLPQILDGVQQNLVGKQIVDVPVSQASGDSTGGRAHNLSFSL